jgi:DNA mismatch repair protein MutL
LPARIVVLNDDIANKIAAGEVVERPASIVKELVENAIDAGASDIRVELTKGGCESIEVIDNGSGIEYDDVPLVFERHATSKIHHFEDIYQVLSFGFRGEAMPSIASIARVEMITRRLLDLAGTRVVIERGGIKEIAPAGSPAGTQIYVTKIFENVPARRKFLKTESTEQGLCLDAVSRLALAYPEINFKVFANRREVLVAPESKNVSDRIGFIMGTDFAGHCLKVDTKKGGVKLFGFISRPQFTRSNSKNIFLFVNKRFVRDNSITHAVLAAYRQIIEARRYPSAVLFLEIPGAEVDVNVHPAKMEVRFKDSRNVYDLVSRTIAESLSVPDSVAEAGFVYRLTPSANTPAFIFQRSQESLPASWRGQYSRQNLQRALTSDLSSRMPWEANGVKENFLSGGYQLNDQITFENLQYMGQFAGSYLIFTDQYKFILIDQHAAHERVIFEKLKKHSDKTIVSQQLLLPEVVSISPGQVNILSDNAELFSQIGLEIEIFGRDAVCVKGVPAVLSQVQPIEIITDIADQLEEQIKLPDLQGKKEKVTASLACRAAIKANTPLAAEEVIRLCRDLEVTPFNTTCPHGRPIIIKFSLGEIERMFKRK